jgi:dihydrofolate synthase/folylpolyglutamate synthase
LSGVSPEQQRAEQSLRSLELFGMRFGLDRMRRMMTVLDSPERSFPTVHVLGTNGKSSTTRMTAAILERHGLATAAYVSPHLVTYRERILIGEREVEPSVFAHAVDAAVRASERVNRTLGEDDHVTQFELLTAAGFCAMAEAEVDVGVIEAGLGGRYDATSVIDAGVTVLTNVGLEHTRWLGPTVSDIAEEKLAVVRAGGTLVLGADLDGQALAVASRVVRERGARIVTAERLPVELRLASRGPFQRLNFALAVAAASAHLETLGRVLDWEAVTAVAVETVVPGRLQTVSDDPLTLLDGAHNPAAVAALVQALPELVGSRPVGLVLGVLEDKDAVSMLRTLLPLCERAWFTAPPSGRALSPAALESHARHLGFEAMSSVPRAAAALSEAQAWARDVGGAVLATGSVYLVGDLIQAQLGGSGSLAPAPARPAGSATSK